MDSFHGQTAFLFLSGDVSKVKFKKEIQRNVVLEEVSLQGPFSNPTLSWGYDGGGRIH